MINVIVTHPNSYTNEHIFSRTHQSYTKPDGSWEDATADDIKQLIAILIYFGIVKVVGDVDKCWSKKTLFRGLWAWAILSRKRFKALMALLHVVDPATEDKADKLHKVESIINYRIYSNKRQGAYLISHATRVVLIYKLYQRNVLFSIFLFNGTLSVC